MVSPSTIEKRGTIKPDSPSMSEHTRNVIFAEAEYGQADDGEEEGLELPENWSREITNDNIRSVRQRASTRGTRNSDSLSTRQ